VRLAVLADIHGNALALEAVLADMRRHAPDLVVDLGDVVSGPLWPVETMELLAGIKPLTVRGNHDRMLTTLSPADMGPSDRYAHGQLSRAQLKQLAYLQPSLEIAPGVVAFHASPDDDTTYLTEEIVAGRIVRAHNGMIAERLGAVSARLVLAGHSHIPRLVRLSSGVSIVNPGSVGCPAYTDSAPPHVSESGSPHARYAIVDLPTTGDPIVRLMALTYPWAEAVNRAEENGRPDWAHALATGTAIG
jgi:predicted phosphodiesterase